MDNVWGCEFEYSIFYGIIAPDSLSLTKLFPLLQDQKNGRYLNEYMDEIHREIAEKKEWENSD